MQRNVTARHHQQTYSIEYQTVLVENQPVPVLVATSNVRSKYL